MKNKNKNFGRSGIYGWKSYKNLRKKAMDHKFSMSGLIFSLSIAFFVVIVTAFILGSFNPANALEGQYKGQVDNWTDNLEISNGEDIEYTVQIKNIGDRTWEKGKVYLETGPYLRSFSDLEHRDWINYYRVAGLDKNIEVGEVAIITFLLQGKKGIHGIVQQNFHLVVDMRPVEGTNFRLMVNLIDEEEQKKQEDIIKIVSAKPNTIKIPKIKTSIKTNINFLENNSEEISKKDDNLQNTDEDIPDFCIALSVAERDHYEECNTDPNESDTTDGITENIIYENEPIIRVGIAKTDRAQRITCTDSVYSVYAGDELLLSYLREDYITTVSFDFNKKKYIVSTPSITKAVTKPIRFVPANPGSVIELIDHDNRPSWNTSLNYNKFRDTIEFQYSNVSGNLWIINELPISNYLKGLAETSNYSPVEFQKVIITAARTYAMYHYNRGIEFGIPDGSTKHAYEHFHLDATYDQVYKGYTSETVIPRLAQAVDETKGVVVTYDGGVVITPYFSRSDGRTRSWEEVWYGGPKPWLTSVSVPQDSGQTLWGHGVGMSARGALIMTTDEGETWENTLRYFYQNTKLERIYK